MSEIFGSAIDRRSLLIGSASLAAAGLISASGRATTRPGEEIKLVAAPGRLPLVGPPHPDTDVWCFGNQIPGPEIRVRQGAPARILVENQLPDETTVHWHGV